MNAVTKFWEEGMLRHQQGQWFVIDRTPMRNCAKHKNCHYPYQVLNSDQSKCMTFRSLKQAITFCNYLYANGRM